MATVSAVSDDTMAPSECPLTNGDKILVTVETALPDVIVVSFIRGAKCFQGALLNASKSGLPCGIQPPEPSQDPEGDKLASVAARFTYFQDKKLAAAGISKIELRRHINPPAKYRNARPTVRLRPRQVLCSKCQSICNENNENVNAGKKRKREEQKQQLDCAVSKAQPETTVTTTMTVTATATRRSERRCNQLAQKNSKVSTRKSLLKNTLSTSEKTTSSTSAIPTIQDSSSTCSLSPNQPPSTESTSTYTCTTVTSDASLSSPLPSTSSTGISAPLSTGSSTPFVVSTDSTRQPTVIPKSQTQQSKIRIGNISQSLETNKFMRSESRSLYWNEDSDSAGRRLSSLETNDCDDNPSTAYCATPRRLSSSSVESAKIPEESDEKISLAVADSTIKSKFIRSTRKKRSVGSMEDLWDESIFEDSSRNAMRTTPVIKISFGTQGEGTVLKIPPKIQDLNYEQDMDEPQCETNGLGDKDLRESPRNLRNQIIPIALGGKDASAKAAKRALKKAKKEARRKLMGAMSPARSPCNGSPRYNPSYDPLSHHRRKHKVKHKKKHKEDRKHKDESSSTNLDESNATYQDNDSNASSGCKSPGSSSDELSEQEIEVEPSETTPDFPSESHPLMMRLSSTPVAHCLTASGRRMDVGDVVWGKIHGFPWWPGKVLSITVSCKEDGTSSGPQAHVAWYGSSTSSLMSCDQLSPFLETFKARYNKKKRGPYKEAIRQAQSEAMSQSAVNTRDNVLNECGSPREVNVMS